MKVDGTVSVLLCKAAVVALDARGIPSAPVLAAAGIAEDVLSRPDARLPVEALDRVWAAAGEASGDRSFGLHAAESFPAGCFELFDYLYAASSTVGEGIERLLYYMSLVNDRAHWELKVEPFRARLTRRIAPVEAHSDEFGITLIVTRSRAATGVDWKAEAMSFQHDRADDGEPARVYGCPVRFGAEATELVFSPSVLALPHRHADSRLLAVLTRYADSLCGSHATTADWAAQVSQAIARELPRSLPTLASIATSLRLPERTLQRRLAAAQVTFTSLLDGVRRELALKYAADAALSIGEIAYMLHFADTTALHRAFRRWTGETPIRYRERLFGGPTGVRGLRPTPSSRARSARAPG